MTINIASQRKIINDADGRKNEKLYIPNLSALKKEQQNKNQEQQKKSVKKIGSH